MRTDKCHLSDFILFIFFKFYLFYIKYISKIYIVILDNTEHNNK